MKQGFPTLFYMIIEPSSFYNNHNNFLCPVSGNMLCTFNTFSYFRFVNDPVIDTVSGEHFSGPFQE